MVHLDLQEQEQLSQLQYFWHSFGKYVVMLIILIMACYFTDTMWNYHKQNQAKEAAQLYASFLLVSERAGSESASLVVVKQLEQEYPNTEYATMASLLMAKSVYQQHNLPVAADLLNWIISHSQDSGLVDIARLRLADVYIDERKFADALHTLMQKHDVVFDPLYYTKRGDVYLVEGNMLRARDAYKEALQKAGDDSEISGSIRLRLDMAS